YPLRHRRAALPPPPRRLGGPPGGGRLQLSGRHGEGVGYRRDTAGEAGSLKEGTMEQGELAWLPGQRIVDIDLGGDQLRQTLVRVVPGWAAWPPFYVRHNGNAQLVCCRYADVVEVLEDSARFSTVRPADPAAGGYVQFKPDKFAAVETLPKMEGERHGRIRRLIAPAFSAPAVQRLENGIDRALDNLI